MRPIVVVAEAEKAKRRGRTVATGIGTGERAEEVLSSRRVCRVQRLGCSRGEIVSR